MMVPLVLLGALSIAGGWLNLPALLPLGPIGVLDRWLEPVVGQATARVAGAGGEAHASTGIEAALIGLAVLIAIAGVALAFARLKPARLVPKREAPPERGIERVLAHNYYVDEAYDRVIVEPTVEISRGLLWRGIDIGIIDTLFVNGSAAVARFVGWIGSQVQSGQVGT
jgi:NADH-quinone oxidoreductase subunit L